MPYKSRLEELKLWSLEDRRKRADLIEVYKMTWGLSAVDFSKFFTLDLQSRTHGHSWKLKKSRFNTDLRQHFFSDRAISWWNTLDEDTVTACSVNSFKAKLQKLKDHSDEFISGHWSPMNSSGQASFPGRPIRWANRWALRSNAQSVRLIHPNSIIIKQTPSKVIQNTNSFKQGPPQVFVTSIHYYYTTTIVLWLSGFCLRLPSELVPER